MRRVGKILVATALAMIPLLNIAAVQAAADTCTWTGSSSANWSDSGNWTGCDNGNTPENGDSLLFPNSASNKTNTNDILGANFNSITITGDSYLMAGNALDLSPTSSSAIQITGANNHVILVVQINGSSSKAISTSNTGNIFSGSITLNLTGGADMNIGSASGSDFTINAVISGNTEGFILNNGPGTVTLNGNNTFTLSGVAQISSDATLVCSTATCLGDSGNLLNIYDTSSFEVSSAVVVPNDITVASGATAAEINFTNDGELSGLVTINDATTMNIANGVTNASVSGDLVINSPGSLTVLGAGTYVNSTVYLGAIVSGDGDLTFDDVGGMMTTSNPTYDGNIVLNSGSSLTALPSALGTTTGDVTVNAGAVLRNGSSPGPYDYADDISFAGTGLASGSYSNGAFYNEGDQVEFSGIVTLAADTKFALRNNNSGGIEFSGQITGPGALSLTNLDVDSGIYTMTGTATNNYTGTTTIEATELDLSKSGGVGIPGDATVEATSFDDALLIIGNTAGNQIADDATLTLVNSAPNEAILGSLKPAEVIGTLTGDGNFYVTGAGQGVTVGGNNTSGTFSGVFTNTNSSVITKTGTGTWNLTSATYGGVAGQGPTIDITDGAVNWGAAVLAELNITVSSGGTLKGTGTTGNATVNSGGAINVGNSPGCMTLTSLTLNSGATFTEEIAGTTACTEYDQTTVSGAADITDSTLSVLPSITPADGTVFTILNAASITGTFSGLAEGATVTASGMQFRINYTATSVTLTKLSGTLSTPSGLTDTGSSIVIQTAAAFLLITLAASTRFMRNYRRSS